MTSTNRTDGGEFAETESIDKQAAPAASTVSSGRHARIEVAPAGSGWGWTLVEQDAPTGTRDNGDAVRVGWIPDDWDDSRATTELDSAGGFEFRDDAIADAETKYPGVFTHVADEHAGHEHRTPVDTGE